jgi:hypothetical protein
VVGEVSGNWATAASFAGDSETEEEILPKQDLETGAAEERYQAFSKPFGETTNWQSDRASKQTDAQSKLIDAEPTVAGGEVSVSLPASATAASGHTITVPVTIGTGFAEPRYESFDFSVFYDPAILTPLASPAENAGTLSTGCAVVSNAPTPGRVIVSGACAQAINNISGGTLLNLRFAVIGNAGQQTALSFGSRLNATEVFRFNNGSPSVSTSNGQLTLVAPTAATVSVSGRVVTRSGRGIRNVTMTMTDSAGNQRQAQTTAFGYYRFDDVTAGETITLTVKARQFKFDQPTIVRTTNESIVDADFVSEH